MMYGDFADVYDALMDDVDYDAWCAYYLQLLRREDGLPIERVAECACGTGSLTVRFAKHGLRMTGIDRSNAMLRRAEAKARAWGVDAAFVHQDMRSLALTRRTDAVLCTCDGVNYLTAPDDVRAFFHAAYDALVPGGLLCFDCSSRRKLEETIGDAFFGEERDGLALLWQNHCNRKTHVVGMDVTVFAREADGRYRRFREEHWQRAHSCEEILLWLHEAGFAQARAYGAMTMRAPDGSEDRVHFKAEKPR